MRQHAAQQMHSVKLSLKPCGRGNWYVQQVEWRGPVDLFTFKVGIKIVVGDREFWITDINA